MMNHVHGWMSGWGWGGTPFGNRIVVAILILLVILIARRVRNM